MLEVEPEAALAAIVELEGGVEGHVEAGGVEEHAVHRVARGRLDLGGLSPPIRHDPGCPRPGDPEAHFGNADSLQRSWHQTGLLGTREHIIRRSQWRKRGRHRRAPPKTSSPGGLVWA